jgi:cell division protein ZapA (FtsZ GTPase activity inhibitor)
MDNLDSMLTNWFFEPNDIYEFLDDLDDAEWEHVWLHRNDYPEFVFQAILSYDPPPILKTKNAKYTVHDLSDYDLFRMQHKQRQVYEKRMIEDWEMFKNENNINRPESEEDEAIQKVSKELEIENNKLAEIETKRSTKYTTRLKRADALLTDKEYLSQKEKVKKLENEHCELLSKIITKDAEWDQQARTKFEKTMLEM